MTTENSILENLTVLVLTRDEAPNIARTLSSLSWAHRILLVDSQSTDDTVAIASSFNQVRIIERAFTNHAEQWNFGLDHIDTKWTLAIDADYVFPESARRYIEKAINKGLSGYRVNFRYLVYGQPTKGSILPSRTILFQTKMAHYWQDGHTQRIRASGEIGSLGFCIDHDDRKPLAHWCRSQINYAKQEVEKLNSTPKDEIGRNDRIRKLILLAPIIVFLLVYFFRGGFLSGWRGLFYAMQRFFAEMLLSLFLVDERLKSFVHGISDSNEDY